MSDSAKQATALPLNDQISLLSGADVWHTQAVPGVPAVRLADGPHGLRVQDGDSDHLGLAASRPATCFPPAVTLASTWDPALVREVGRAIAAEAREQGVGVVLGPGLNIKRHPLCGRNFEYFSEDPLLAGRLAAAMVEGIQASGDVGACPKHFAVNNQEYHRFVSDVIVDERTLRELYLSGFEYVVKHAAPWALMTAYNPVNGQPCSAHQHLLGEILRGEWEYDGLVMSDWGATTRRTEGVLAGMDLEMPSSGGFYDRELREAVAGGSLSPNAVAACAQRVLDLAARAVPVKSNLLSLDTNHEIARTAAIAGTVLLHNDGVLPLGPQTRVALIGAFAEQPRFQGTGSSQVNPTRVSTLREAFTEYAGQVTYAPGYDP
ncbi:MAG TPA: glycoside hydrolase family 3 N-terminal domain-containing protein, partial [Marmoricola sp.]|nr:glycoside hydrolase family 3 N-terminal domain-containing protein [Marmoricola sp.]